jgi:hypothetical protein
VFSAKIPKRTTAMLLMAAFLKQGILALKITEHQFYLLEVN